MSVWDVVGRWPRVAGMGNSENGIGADDEVIQQNISKVGQDSRKFKCFSLNLFFLYSKGESGRGKM